MTLLVVAACVLLTLVVVAVLAVGGLLVQSAGCLLCGVAFGLLPRLRHRR